MKRSWFHVARVLAVLAVLVAARCVAAGPPAGAPPEGAAVGEAEILAAFEQRESDRWVEASGTVDRLLPDDNDGSRHQRFILRLPSGHTVLISHNIDLAPRLDGLDRGAAVAFRGEYEWNAQGGVVHWTHHDPSGALEGGWLEHGGRRYR